MSKKITELNESNKDFLLSKTPYSLPDNPSSKGFSAQQIKTAMYGGYVVIYEWLKKISSETNGAIESIETDIDSLKEISQGGSLFIPALQSEEPNSRKVKVWLDDSENSKNKNYVLEYDTETESYTFDDSTEYEFNKSVEYEFDDSSETESYTFDDSTEYEFK